ncbi:MAG: hypothetical protein AAB691_00850 [Patescibacteria group bacterium]
MLNDKVILGLLTIAIGIVSYSIYFQNIFRGKIKPDPFSWLIWGMLATITFFAQMAGAAGPGAWATALTAVVCFLISFSVYLRHDGKIQPIDSVSLIGAVFAIGIWYATSDPLWAVLLSILIGAIGFARTLKKAFRRPIQEAAITYFLNAVKFTLAIFALEIYTPLTFLYPVSLVFMNLLLVGVLLLRRLRP